jgi:hypothetical protein
VKQPRRIVVEAGMDSRMLPKMVCFMEGGVVPPTFLEGKTFTVLCVPGQNSLFLEEVTTKKTTTTKEKHEKPSTHYNQSKLRDV